MMRGSATFDGIFLYRSFVDMRKSINGLSQIVSEDLKVNPCNGSLFVFISRDRTNLKALYWDKSGFALWQKRLEKEKFRWPKSSLTDSIELNSEQLDWLLSGLDIEKVKPHEILSYHAFS